MVVAVESASMSQYDDSRYSDGSEDSDTSVDSDSSDDCTRTTTSTRSTAATKHTFKSRYTYATDNSETTGVLTGVTDIMAEYHVSDEDDEGATYVSKRSYAAGRSGKKTKKRVEYDSDSSDEETDVRDDGIDDDDSSLDAETFVDDKTVHHPRRMDARKSKDERRNQTELSCDTDDTDSFAKSDAISKPLTPARARSTESSFSMINKVTNRVLGSLDRSAVDILSPIKSMGSSVSSVMTPAKIALTPAKNALNEPIKMGGKRVSSSRTAPNTRKYQDLEKTVPVNRKKSYATAAAVLQQRTLEKTSALKRRSSARESATGMTQNDPYKPSRQSSALTAGSRKSVKTEISMKSVRSQKASSRIKTERSSDESDSCEESSENEDSGNEGEEEDSEEELKENIPARRQGSRLSKASRRSDLKMKAENSPEKMSRKPSSLTQASNKKGEDLEPHKLFKHSSRLTAASAKSTHDAAIIKPTRKSSRLSSASRGKYDEALIKPKRISSRLSKATGNNDGADDESFALDSPAASITIKNAPEFTKQISALTTASAYNDHRKKNVDDYQSIPVTRQASAKTDVSIKSGYEPPYKMSSKQASTFSKSSICKKDKIAMTRKTSQKSASTKKSERIDSVLLSEKKAQRRRENDDDRTVATIHTVGSVIIASTEESIEIENDRDNENASPGKKTSGKSTGRVGTDEQRMNEGDSSNVKNSESKKSSQRAPLGMKSTNTSEARKDESQESTEDSSVKAKLALILSSVVKAARNENWKKVISLCKENPGIISMKSPKTEQNLTHILARQKKRVPGHVVEELCRLRPQAIAAADRTGRTPVHYAGALGNKSDLVGLLLKTYPQGAERADNDGNTPLHLAADVGRSSEKTVQLLLDFCPQVIDRENSGKSTPLHLACAVPSAIASVDNISAILEVHRELKIEPSSLDVDGSSPLHLAIKSKGSPQIITAFQAKADIKLFLQPNGDGDLPLHVALTTSDVSPISISSIVKAAEFAGGVPTSTGAMPVALAVKQDMPNHTIKAIMLADMPIDIGTRLQAGNEHVVRRQHGHSWWHVVVENGKKYEKIVEEIFSKHATKSQIIALARTLGPNESGKVIDNACHDIKVLFQKHLRFYSRYELSTAVPPRCTNTVEVFHAIDHGPDSGPRPSPKSDQGGNDYMGDVTFKHWTKVRQVVLRCFSSPSSFNSELHVRKRYSLSSDYVEEILNTHNDNNYKQYAFNSGKLFCICYEKPDHTLAEIFSKNIVRSQKWLAKCSTVLRNIALAVEHIHQQGTVHGYLTPSIISKYGPAWKLSEVGTLTPIGRAMSGPVRSSVPPESIINLMEGLAMAQDQVSPSSTLRSGTTAGSTITGWSKLSSCSSDLSSFGPGVSKSSPFGSRYSNGSKDGANRSPAFSYSSSSTLTNSMVGHKVTSHKPSKKRAGFLLFGMTELGLGGMGAPENDNNHGDLSSTKSEDSHLLQEAEKRLGEREAEIHRLRRELKEREENTKKEMTAMKKQVREREKKISQKHKRREQRLGKKVVAVKAAVAAAKLVTAETFKKQKLKFSPEKCIASPVWDVWSFGLLMAQLILGRSTDLPSFDKNEEEENLYKLYAFKSPSMLRVTEEVRKVAGDNAADLISKMLHPSPEHRMSTMSKALQHKYFRESKYKEAVALNSNKLHV
uniref:Protein kinase domain-containing protein n=1 Tax=Corethron hystrix TaxID=216773 RepID=A0A7S1G3W0_9STRA|mmetsp:Transcript_9695/g.21570  ORF Transcript_9695/g.21570 Transcript_9695/m.21570 type:complete len:1660 (+) Transcript_9695:288-5267(+)